MKTLYSVWLTPSSGLSSDSFAEGCYAESRDEALNAVMALWTSQGLATRLQLEELQKDGRILTDPGLWYKCLKCGRRECWPADIYEPFPAIVCLSKSCHDAALREGISPLGFARKLLTTDYTHLPLMELITRSAQLHQYLCDLPEDAFATLLCTPQKELRLFLVTEVLPRRRHASPTPRGSKTKIRSI